MSTQVSPENEEKEQDPQQTSTQTSSTQEETPTEPIPLQEDPSREMAALYGEVIREKEARIKQLEAQQQQKQEPELTPDAQKNRFFNEPMTVLREEIQKTIAPLVQFTQTFQNQQVYDKIKNRFRVDPRFKDIFPSVESTVDHIMSQSEVTEQNVNAAVLSAIGMYTTGLIPTTNQQTSSRSAAPQNPQSQQKRDVVTPPHLRPAAPASPSGEKKKEGRELTENERRLARASKMTDEQYLNFIDVDPSSVATYKGDKDA